MKPFDMKKEVTTLMGQKFGSFYASKKALQNKYNYLGGGNPQENKSFIKFYINTGGFPESFIVSYAFANSYYENGKEKLEIEDLTTGRNYSTGWAKELKTDKFNFIMTHGYTIKDNGNGIIDENDTIMGNELKKEKTLGEFLKEA